MNQALAEGRDGEEEERKPCLFELYPTFKQQPHAKRKAESEEWTVLEKTYFRFWHYTKENEWKSQDLEKETDPRVFMEAL